ncbi:DUF3658 domain-containing protein [Alicyclobacillus pomorum]|uniref:DUF3658 domain-containing protein n=1 Tax=Alicyclobacillus pomorum TaxID=204470 RepID=UPI0012EC35AD
MGDSPTEYTDMMCVLAYLQCTIPASVVMVSSAYHKRYKKFRPRSTCEVTSEKMITLLEDAKILSQRVRERYVANWNRLLEDKGTLRILKNRQVETVPEDYFDPEIIRLAQKTYRQTKRDFVAARLVGDFLARQEQGMMDAIAFWRIRCLIQQGVFSYEGSMNNMLQCRIKPMNV